MIKIMEDVDLNIVRKITLNQAKTYEVIPLYKKEDKIYVGTTNNNEKGREYLQFLLQKEIVYIEIDKEELMHLIDILLDYNYENIEERIFGEAIKMEVSDIHFEPIKNDVNVRFRINGSLVLVRKLTLEEYGKINSRLKIKSNMDITEKRKPQDGKLFMTYEDINYNCRLSSIPIIYGEKIVLRILYGEKYLSSVECLNFTKEQLKVLKKIINLENGLVIVNGPTGSGKSTTLYSIINEVKADHINITTLEDPIEITLEGINQINLNPKIGLAFASGLRSVLRQDPDVIMVGEIRDEETAKMAVRASITGHKVYSTIHTKSPREVFLRLEEMGVKSYLVRASLAGVISQRLIRVICSKCKRKIGEINIDSEVIPIFAKNGCKNCNRTGFVGRTLVSSVHYLGNECTKNIYENENVLSNNQMLLVLKKLLKEESIDYYDYLQFIEGERLDRDEL
ncbi:GspE/PulE family protein [Clostridium sp. SHJSY1]|uniref:GspE/PulE family protein n=1 Tax=Clostridium sp. SHJSY1 TaxID=2942483 RepID=UPI0028767FE8|nr:GspE/PulE family protein [Clostridium sp. SHJSY1]MDS0527318.1 GspE/PulE family protein [Clostridium sp. SHJSY1]